MPDAVYRGRYRGKKYKRKVKALDMPDPMKTSVPRLSMKSGNLLTSKGGDVTEESGRMLDRALMRKSYEKREGIAKGRTVRTPAGAKRYGVPIGTPISAAKAKQKLAPFKARMTTTEKLPSGIKMTTKEIKTKSGAKIPLIKPKRGGRMLEYKPKPGATLSSSDIKPPPARRVGRSASEIRGLTGDFASVGRKQTMERAKRQTENARRRQAARLADGAIGDLGDRPSSGRKPSKIAPPPKRPQLSDTTKMPSPTDRNTSAKMPSPTNPDPSVKMPEVSGIKPPPTREEARRMQVMRDIGRERLAAERKSAEAREKRRQANYVRDMEEAAANRKRREQMREADKRKKGAPSLRTRLGLDQ